MQAMESLRSKWSSRFMAAAVVQAGLAIGLTAFLLYFAVFGVPAASKVVAGGGAGMWLTVGFLAYLIFGLLAVPLMALFYRHMEVGLGKPYRGAASALAWAHLILYNIGVIGATFLMMYAGYQGGGAALSATSGGLGYNPGQVHTLIMVNYPLPIAAFVAVALAGGALGFAGYVLTWARRAKAPVSHKGAAGA